MSGWGISPSASEKEKIKAEWADELIGKDSTGKITYDVYSELFDVGMDLLDRMYELGKSDGRKEREKGHWVEGKYSYECSICNGGYVGLPKTSYCPFCGAEMSEEE